MWLDTQSNKEKMDGLNSVYGCRTFSKAILNASKDSKAFVVLLSVCNTTYSDPSLLWTCTVEPLEDARVQGWTVENSSAFFQLTSEHSADSWEEQSHMIVPFFLFLSFSSFNVSRDLTVLPLESINAISLRCEEERDHLKELYLCWLSMHYRQICHIKTIKYAKTL